MTNIKLISFIAMALIAMIMQASAFANTQEYTACIMRGVDDADDNDTIGDLRAKCNVSGQPEDSLVNDRLKQDKRNTLEPFTILSHQPNYLLLANHNSKGYQNSLGDAFGDFDDRRLDNTEAQFQVSLKVPLATNLFNRNVDIFGAYTVRSFWQIYNADESRPFRETNHEPELWLQAYPNWRVFGLNNAVVRLGINHQSNGRPDPISRSWNRAFVDFVFAKDNFALSFKPWIRISEDIDDDDNPDIGDFLGHYELRGLYKRVISTGQRNTLSLS
jgi:phospholipase A1